MQIVLREPPVGFSKWETGYSLRKTGSLGPLPPDQYPFVVGELGEILIWLDCFKTFPINGWLEFMIHEGLAQGNGDLVVHEMRAFSAVQVIIPTIFRRFRAFAQIKGTDQRIKANYTLTWKH